MFKDELRRLAKAYTPPYTKDEIKHRFAEHGQGLILDSHTFGVFSAIGTEPDLSLLAKRAMELGKTVLYPRVEGEKLVFAPVDKKNMLALGSFSILEPKTPAFNGKIDLIFVPGLMFGLNGSRLGRGAGYYDRYLVNIKGIKVGVCFEHNLRESLPEEPHDMRVDGILTEKRIIWCHKK
ncbi:MAG: 5-formyltetrahydrofolate cyclo-ligase [Brevinema sp.]